MMHDDAALATNNPTDTPITPPDDNDDSNVDDERQVYMEMEKEELVTLTLCLKQEVLRNNSKIQSLTIQWDMVLEKKPQM